MASFQTESRLTQADFGRESMEQLDLCQFPFARPEHRSPMTPNTPQLPGFPHSFVTFLVARPASQ